MEFLHFPVPAGERRQLRRNSVDQQRIRRAQICLNVNERRAANAVRIAIAHDLGADIDGAWWPRVDRMTNELPNLVAALHPLLGDITSIVVNWPPLQRPPDFNWPGWERKPQHVMTVNGVRARANLLVIPYATNSGLALMVLRRAAGLPVMPADREKPAFQTAGSILRAAATQRTSDVGDQVPQKVR